MTETMLDWSGPDLLDAAEVRRVDGDLLVLDAAGGISCIDLESGAVALLGTVILREQAIEDDGRYGVASRWRLHASADGAFAAIVFDGASHGVVVDLDDFRITLTLDGGEYYPQTVAFSLCFLSLRGNAVVVHRTAWNRLDASDPRTGALLTQRGPTTYVDGQAPPHYLDYFHGRLHPNPSGSRLLDDGWVWQPVGIPRVFDAVAWLTGNVWESEDGPSVLALTYCDDWNVPACWIDDDRIALGSMSDWNDEEFASDPAPAGIRIVDLSQPSTTPDRKLPMSAAPQALFANARSIFAAHGTDTSVWSVDSGDCTQVLHEFQATHHHRRRQELLEVTARRIRRVSIA
ncbi:hypothetical protein [Lysobacter capsici]|uniref:hypothetical protein n=1 Tax=Lysobacter capsici TaxID=435897 RepID=UPI001C00054E|nr:hypothetical protein [Lysobacter capsici]MBW8810026.1 hypothetical protein [Lysobacter sp.]QWF19051.1 hypothetical protein KME82_10095 [Lysobacter capsici]